MMNNADRNFMWDYFVDDCTANGLNPDDQDFDAWCDNQVDQAIDDAVWG